MFARRVHEALTKQGGMDDASATALARRYTGEMVAAKDEGDSPEDFAHDLFMLGELDVMLASEGAVS